MPNLLPRLIENHNVQAAPPGQFLNVSSGALLAISDALETNPATVQVNSIPDIWARFLLFEAALFDPRHRLHSIVLGEWRGLLALLALKEIKDIKKLSCIPLSLKNINTDNNPNQVLHNSLTKLIPKSQIYQNTSWENLFIFTIDNRVIGATSPTTLIATATSYPTLTLSRSQISWYEENRFKNPNNFNLSVIDKDGLASWLNNLYNQLQPMAVLDDFRANCLLGLIRGFRDDVNIQPPIFTPAQFGIGISGSAAGVLSLLDRPAKPQSILPTESNVRLIPSLSRTPSKPMLLVDRDIAEKWQVNHSELLIHKTLTLDSIPYEGLLPNIHNSIGSTQIDDADIWRPKDLFTDNIFYIQGKEAFPKASLENWHGNPPQINSQPISIILPINQMLLEHLTPKDILDSLSFTQNDNGDIKLIFTAELSGINGQPKIYEIEKNYTRDQLLQLDQSPVLEIFPNFSSPSWNAYYIAYSANSLNDTFIVSPFPSEGQATNITIPNNQGGLRQMWRLENYPEAFVCSFNQRNRQVPDEIGLLLLPIPEVTPSATRDYTVGVDFGASGTMIYCSDGNQKIPLEFKNRKSTITNVSSTQKAEVLKFFLPEDDITPAFLTLYQDFNNSSNQPDPILNGHIYYLIGVGTDLDDPNIYPNLKWSGAANTNFRVKSFLAQVCLQASAELTARGASSINWRYSYPTAFSTHQTNNFNQYWQQIVTETSKLTGITSAPPVGISESVASAECFRNGGASLNAQEASTETGAIFVDIGGSTSDISIWQNNQLRTQLSLRYAGRDVFHSYLWKHLEIFDIFGIDKKPLEKIRESKEKFWSQTDSVLRQHSQKIFSDLPAYFEDKRLNPFKQYLTVGLAGLFYYLGLNTKYLVETNNFNAVMPHIYFGGNGSQMFRWLCSGANITDSHPLVNLFKDAFTTAADSNLIGVFNLTMSERLKHESAYGLVCPHQLHSGNHQSFIITGESFTQNETKYEWNTALTTDLLREKLTSPEEFIQLKNFVNTFNKFAENNQGWIDPIILSEKVVDFINRFVDNRLSDNSEQKVIFILALRGLLETIS